MSGHMIGPMGVAPAASGFDAATTAWVAAVVAAGGAVSATQKTRVDTLITGLKSDSLFTLIDRLWLFAGESDAKQANIDIVNLGTHTPQGTITLSAAGYTGNASTGYLDSNFTPSSAGGQFTQNSCHIGAYVNTQTGGTWIGTTDTGGGYYAYLSGAATFCAELNSGGFPAYSVPGNGLYVVSRTGSATFNVYRNGGGATALTDTSSGNINNKLFISASCGNAGSPTSFSSDPLKAAWFGGGLNATQAGNLATRINTYMTAWGVNTF